MKQIVIIALILFVSSFTYCQEIEKDFDIIKVCISEKTDMNSSIVTTTIRNNLNRNILLVHDKRYNSIVLNNTSILLEKNAIFLTDPLSIKNWKINLIRLDANSEKVFEYILQGDLKIFKEYSFSAQAIDIAAINEKTLKRKLSRIIKSPNGDIKVKHFFKITDNYPVQFSFKANRNL